MAEPDERDEHDDGTDDAPMRIDELARIAGVASTTIRLYQAKGLLPPPSLVGRTGFYDGSHLARLRVIARLQDEGFSLAGISRLLETWEEGGALGELVGVERELDALLSPRHEAVLDAGELIARFPAGALEPALIQRAAALGVVEATETGRFRVPDARFIDTGADLAQLGVPLDVILDEWEHLAGVTDDLAARFIALFEEHLLAPDWRDGLDAGRTAALADTLARLRRSAEQVVLASLDTSVARLGASRFAELLPE